MIPLLPKDATDPAARARALSRAQDCYAYELADNPLAPVAVAGKFPFKERYGLDWALPYLPQFLRSFVDTQSKKALFAVAGLLSKVDKLEAFAELFSPVLDLPPPPTIDTWRSDGGFARRWLDGPDPLHLERVRDLATLAQKIPLSDADLQRAIGGTRTLADELAAGNLYLIDYALLEQSLSPDGLPHRDSRWRDKYLPSPIMLFCQRPGVEPLCELVPVAIRVDQPQARAPNPVYLREPTPRWLLARLYVDVADFNLQAMSSHIYRHHYVAEPFAVTTPRQLAPEHPMYLLLQPHLRYTIAVNNAAFGLLKKEGSVFDTIYAGELSETRNIMKRSYQRWTYREQELERDLLARGVENGPREYPYRDDARLWVPVIDRFVKDYVALYYNSDADVQGDGELQAWFAELTSPDGGRLRALTASGHLGTVAELCELLSQLLFTVGPGHAAVHYPQTDYFTYVPMMPGAAYRPPPLDGETITDGRIVETLPPISRGADQFQNNQIAYYRFDRFGDYSAYPLGKVDAAKPLIARLQSELMEVEAQIDARNRSRPRPYLYLLPSLVPNSINV